MEKIEIKFIPTGLTFEVDKTYADELLRDEPHNFVAIDKDYKPAEEPKEPTIYETIVVEEEPKEVKKIKRSRV